MKISIIIPSLNEENTITDLLGQLRDANISRELEIIVSDGGSTDSTIAKAIPYADKIIVCDNINEETIAAGRNRGAEEATGDLLLFVNCDVIIDKPALFMEKLATLFSDLRILAYSCYVKIDPAEETFVDKIMLGFYNIYFKILNDSGIGMGRGELQAVRKNVFRDAGGYNSRLAAGEDFDLFIRIRKKGKIYYDKRQYVYESPRRFRKYGHCRIFFSWLSNALSVIFFKRSSVKKWVEVR